MPQPHQAATTPAPASEPSTTATSSPSSSPARIEANRANAQLSSGPVTAEGKAASSQNATKHGLNSATGIFVQPHETEAFTELETNLSACYRPDNEAERQLFLLILHAAWNLRRCRLLEAALQNEANAAGILDPLLDDNLGRKAERIQRYARSAERSHHAAVRELTKLQTEQSYRQEAISEIADEFSVTTNQKDIQKQLLHEIGAKLRNDRFEANEPYSVFKARMDAAFPPLFPHHVRKPAAPQGSENEPDPVAVALAELRNKPKAV